MATEAASFMNRDGSIGRRSMGMEISFRFAAFVSVIVLLSSGACRSQEQIVSQQRKTLVSVQQTVSMIGNAWASGSVSPTYARTSLEQTLSLLETARADLVASPPLLADPVAQDLS